jgi:FkbH-like protein
MIESGLSAMTTPSPQRIKCVVWDLDNTIWQGTLLENDKVILRPGIIDILQTLDNRGILHSIASRNDYAIGMAKLEEFRLAEYFLHPQIGWGSKSDSVKNIANLLNISTKSMAFIDDQIYEREEVRFSLQDVLCIDAAHLDQLVHLPEMMPVFITDESRQRRSMYLNDIERSKVEAAFDGPKEEFLSTLGMELQICRASLDDLQRAEELTVRTHQLNTTGYTYSYDELNFFRQSPDHTLLIANLEDRFGTYGKIGLALIETTESLWTIKLLLMSCRVMSRGVGSVFINFIRHLARDEGVRLHAEFLQTDANRMMYMTYKFTHFSEIKSEGNFILFENDLSKRITTAGYLKIVFVP